MEIHSSFSDIYDSFLKEPGFFYRYPSIQADAIPFLPWDMPSYDRGHAQSIGARFLELKPEQTPKNWMKMTREGRLEEGLLLVAGHAHPFWIQSGFEKAYGAPDGWTYPKNKVASGFVNTESWKQALLSKAFEEYPSLKETSLNWREAGVEAGEGYLSKSNWSGYWKALGECQKADWTSLHIRYNSPLLVLMRKSTLLYPPSIEPHLNTWVWSNPRLDDLNLNLNMENLALELSQFLKDKMPKHRTSLFQGKELAQKPSTNFGEIRLDW